MQVVLQVSMIGEISGTAYENWINNKAQGISKKDNIYKQIWNEKIGISLKISWLPYIFPILFDNISKIFC